MNPNMNTINVSNEWIALLYSKCHMHSTLSWSCYLSTSSILNHHCSNFEPFSFFIIGSEIRLSVWLLNESNFGRVKHLNKCHVIKAVPKDWSSGITRMFNVPEAVGLNLQHLSDWPVRDFVKITVTSTKEGKQLVYWRKRWLIWSLIGVSDTPIVASSS